MNQSSTLPAKDFNQEKVYFFMEAAKTFGHLIFSPMKSVPFRNTTADLSIPAAIFLFVGGNFLLMINNLPLFTDPHKSISVHQFIYGTSAYLQDHTFANLLGKYWTVFTFTIAGWITIIFAIHSRSQPEQMYVLGVTLNILSAILLFLMISYGIGLLLIKLEQVRNINNWLAHFLPRELSVARAIFSLVLYPMSCISIKVVRQIGGRGAISLLAFTLLLIGVYHIFDYYFKPMFVIRHPKTSTAPISPDSVTTKKAFAYSPTPEPAFTVKARNNKITFLTKYHSQYYTIAAQLQIANNLDTVVCISTRQPLTIQLVAGDVLLLHQQAERSPDFKFSFAKPTTGKNRVLKIPPHSVKQITIETTISHSTYDYLLRKLRQDVSEQYHATIHELNSINDDQFLAAKILFSIKFVNGERLGSVE